MWHKYNAKRTEVDGIKFDSLAEARRYGELKLLLKHGKISELKIHPGWPIVIKDTKVCLVKMDFSYVNADGVHIIEDVKGRDLPMSKLKRKMFEAYYEWKVDVIKT